MRQLLKTSDINLKCFHLMCWKAMRAKESASILTEDQTPANNHAFNSCGKAFRKGSLVYGTINIYNE